MADPAGVTEFYREEADYWADRAQTLELLISQFTRYTTNRHDPPEPPIGTTYWTGTELSWSRTDKGWFCSRQNCPNCPTDWVGMRDFYPMTRGTRVLPGEPTPSSNSDQR
jgi:hypothetical protein